MIVKNLNIPRLCFWLSCLILIFGYGVAVGRYQYFPYDMLRTGWVSLTQVHAERETLLRIRPTELLQPARYSGNGVTRFNAADAAPGLTLVSTFFDKGNEMRLLRLDGTVVHRWPIRFFEIFDNPEAHIPTDQVPRSEWNIATHGAMALPDGSLVFNFNYFGTAKLDRCGAVVWILPDIMHHSLAPSEDGGFWIPGQRSWHDSSPFPLLRPPYEEQTIVKVSASGTVVRELSLLDIFFTNGLEALLLANGLGANDLAARGFTHLNDIEELTTAMAPSFPMFAAGDLLLSLRNLNMLMVIDPDTMRVKWYRIGPWIAQHDPDFQPTGRISVFNNNNDRTGTGSLLGGSTIMEVDPKTGETTVRYGGTPDQPMFSDIRGEHQYLDNGNILIVESQGGRVIEVNPSGAIVWEFVNRFDESRAGIIMAAARYGDRYFTVTDWTCP